MFEVRLGCQGDEMQPIMTCKLSLAHVRESAEVQWIGGAKVPRQNSDRKMAVSVRCRSDCTCHQSHAGQAKGGAGEEAACPGGPPRVPCASTPRTAHVPVPAAATASHSHTHLHVRNTFEKGLAQTVPGMQVLSNVLRGQAKGRSCLFKSESC